MFAVLPVQPQPGAAAIPPRPRSTVAVFDEPRIARKPMMDSELARNVGFDVAGRASEVSAVGAESMLRSPVRRVLQQAASDVCMCGWTHPHDLSRRPGQRGLLVRDRAGRAARGRRAGWLNKTSW